MSNIEELESLIKDLKIENKKLESMLKKVNEKSSSVNIVINTNKTQKSLSKLLVLQHKINKNQFKVFRIQKKSEKEKIDTHSDDYDVFYNNYELDPISCFNYLKNKLKFMKYIYSRYNDVVLINTTLYTIQHFKNDLENLSFFNI